MNKNNILIYRGVAGTLTQLGYGVSGCPRSHEEMIDFLSEFERRLWSAKLRKDVRRFRSAQPHSHTHQQREHMWYFILSLLEKKKAPNYVVRAEGEYILTHRPRKKRNIDGCVVAPFRLGNNGYILPQGRFSFSENFRVKDLCRFSECTNHTGITPKDMRVYSILLSGGCVPVRIVPLDTLVEEVTPQILVLESQSGLELPLAFHERKHDTISYHLATDESLLSVPEQMMQGIVIDVFTRHGFVLLDREYDTPKGVGDLIFRFRSKIVVIEVKYANIVATIEQAKKYASITKANHTIAITRIGYFCSGGKAMSRICEEAIMEINRHMLNPHSVESRMLTETLIDNEVFHHYDSIWKLISLYFSFLSTATYAFLVGIFIQQKYSVLCFPQGGIEDSGSIQPDIPSGKQEEDTTIDRKEGAVASSSTIDASAQPSKGQANAQVLASTNRDSIQSLNSQLRTTTIQYKNYSDPRSIFGKGC